LLDKRTEERIRLLFQAEGLPSLDLKGITKQIFMANSTSKTIKGLSTQTVVTISMGILEIILFSIMSRLLSKDDFGYYAAISAVVLIFSSFSETGIGAAIIQKKTISKRFIDNAFTLSFLFGSLLTVLMFALSGVLADVLIDKTAALPLRLMSITLLLNCLTSVNLSIIYRKLHFKIAGIVNLSSLVLTSIIAVLLAIKGYGYYAIIAKAVLVSVISFLFSFYYAKTKYNLALDKETCSSIFKFSGWLMASVVFRNISHQIDRLLMPKLLSVSQLGAYNRPKDFVGNISNKLNGIFDTALFPVLSSLQDNPKSLNSAFEKSFYYLNLLSTLLSLTFIVNSSLIIHIFFGNRWLYLQPILCIFSLSIIFNADGRLADCYLRSLAMTKQQLFFRIAETVIKTLCVIFAARFDISGVAISIVSSDILIKIIKILYVSRKLNFDTMRVFRILIDSWRCLLVLIPISFVFFIIVPPTVYGNVVLLLLFLTFVLAIFFAFPSFVGSLYYHNVYPQIKSFLLILKIKIQEK